MNYAVRQVSNVSQYLGIPAVVLLDHQQNVITVDGRNIISEDPDGQVLKEKLFSCS